MKCFIPLFLLFNLTLTAQQYFYSNSLAMELEKIPSIESVVMEDEEWILKKTVDRSSSELILYQFGREKKRETKSVSFNREYVDGVLSEEILYGKDEQISAIVRYNDSGLVSEKELYKYNSDGDILMITRTDEKGDILSELEYSMREDGSLRIISLSNGDDVNHRETWNSYSGSLFMVERNDLSNREMVFYNNQNNIEQIRQFRGDQLIAEKNYTYYDDGIIKQIEKKYLQIDEVQIESMNTSGQIIRKDAFKGELLLYSNSYDYSGKTLIQKEKTGTGINERWMYFYSGDELSREEYYRQGVLTQKKMIADSDSNSYTIELYDRGMHFMNLIYLDEVKIREEYISGEKIVRTRELGDS